MNGFSHLSVVGQFGTWQEALPELRVQRPHVVLLNGDAVEAGTVIDAVATAAGGAKVVALSVGEDSEVLRLAEAGISGYVTRDGSVADVVTVVEEAARGELSCSRRVAADVFRHVALLARNTEPDGGHLLTEREREIVGLIGAGLSNREIGEQLLIERATVKNHVHNILTKLKVSRRADAAAWQCRATEAPDAGASLP